MSEATGNAAFRNVLWSSKADDWETPWNLFNALNDEFEFTVDVCAHPLNKKLDRYWSLEDDGLAQDWSKEICFMNPPYGREIPKWLKKAYEESLRGATVVCFIYSRTDTKWWHEFVMHADEIRFIKGRTKAEGVDDPSPAAHCVVVFRPPNARVHKSRYPQIFAADQTGQIL